MLLVGSAWATHLAMHDPIRQHIPGVIGDGLDAMRDKLCENRAGAIVDTMGSMTLALPGNVAAIVIGSILAAVSFPVFMHLYHTQEQSKEQQPSNHTARLQEKREQPLPNAPTL